MPLGVGLHQKVVESTLIPTAKKPKDKTDEAPIDSTSRESISKDTNVIIVHTMTFGPTPINFDLLKVVTKTEA